MKFRYLTPVLSFLSVACYQAADTDDKTPCTQVTIIASAEASSSSSSSASSGVGGMGDGGAGGGSAGQGGEGGCIPDPVEIDPCGVKCSGLKKEGECACAFDCPVPEAECTARTCSITSPDQGTTLVGVCGEQLLPPGQPCGPKDENGYATDTAECDINGQCVPL